VVQILYHGAGTGSIICLHAASTGIGAGRSPAVDEQYRRCADRGFFLIGGGNDSNQIVETLRILSFVAASLQAEYTPACQWVTSLSKIKKLVSLLKA
jgi:hypothetical protein